MADFNVDIITLFPEIFKLTMEIGIMGRAIRSGIVDLKCHQIRDFSTDKHKRVDDYPFGGGNGMVMMAEPIFQTFEHIKRSRNMKPLLVMMSPKGRVLNQDVVNEMRNIKNMAILCGRYEGVDQRLIDEIVDEEISIGNYVLTGGEVPALVFLDTIIRTLPGVLSSKECFEHESHYNKTLEYPQYTRPQVWHNRKVPQVLISGNHKEIADWKEKNSLKIDDF